MNLRCGESSIKEHNYANVRTFRRVHFDFDTDRAAHVAAGRLYRRAGRSRQNHVRVDVLILPVDDLSNSAAEAVAYNVKGTDTSRTMS